MLQGIAAAPGIAIGKAFIFSPEQLNFEKRMIVQEDVPKELFRLQTAIDQAHKELSTIYNRMAKELGRDRAGIFQAQLMILEDPGFESEIAGLVKECTNVEAAVGDVATHYIKFYGEAQGKEHMRERAADYRDVGCRLLRILLGQSWSPGTRLTENAIVIAKELTAADTVELDRSKILGFAIESGGRTSTATILARSLEVPAVVGLGRVLGKVNCGDTVIIDGGRGTMLVNPDEKTLADYRSRNETYLACKHELQSLQDLPAVTLDGYRVSMLANIDHPGEVSGALAQGADGIGLFRTEYLFMGREEPPHEEEQFEAYMQVVRELKGRPVVIRTLDVGGEKSPWYMVMPYEPNPFLGCRGIRMSLNFEDVFRSQLRAILRAGAHGPVKVMFPMVSRVEEMRRAKALMVEAKQELDRAGVPYDRNMQVGLLVEVPAAALTAELFGPEVDFYSIGTNDLVQYTLAVDRMSDVSPIDQALHPAVVRLVRHIIDAAKHVRKPVSMCGEMAGQPLSAPLLVGLGLNQFSAAAGSLPEVKKVIRAITLKDSRELAAHILHLATPEEVKDYIENWMNARRLYY